MIPDCSCGIPLTGLKSPFDFSSRPDMGSKSPWKGPSDLESSESAHDPPSPINRDRPSNRDSLVSDLAQLASVSFT